MQFIRCMVGVGAVVGASLACSNHDKEPSQAAAAPSPVSYVATFNSHDCLNSLAMSVDVGGACSQISKVPRGSEKIKTATTELIYRSVNGNARAVMGYEGVIFTCGNTNSRSDCQYVIREGILSGGFDSMKVTVSYLPAKGLGAGIQPRQQQQ